MKLKTSLKVYYQRYIFQIKLMWWDILLLLKGLKGLLGFLSIMPFGMESIDSISKVFFLCPLIAIVLGSIIGVIGLVSSIFLPNLISGFLVLVCIQILTGFHHFDGLIDFSDAAMARGDTKHRLEVMHDMFTGAAAVASGIIVLTLTGMAYGQFSGLELLIVAVVAEVVAKESMVLTSYLGKTPTYKGMGYFIVESMQNQHIKTTFSLILCFVVGVLMVGIWFILVFATMLIAVLILTSYATNTLDSITGDVLGATNEINRMIALVMLVAVMI
jgi:adenosylcobinamide-GDP ribazoletransferase